VIHLIAIFEANDWPRFKLYYSQALLIKDRFSLKSIKSGKKDRDSENEGGETLKETADEVATSNAIADEEAK
jgi:hypothetical protein